MPNGRNAESRILVYDACYTSSKVVIVLVYDKVFLDALLDTLYHCINETFSGRTVMIYTY